jgi:hypothetical protein
MDEFRFARNFILCAAVIVISGIGGCMRYMPEYTVWSQEMVGKAELSRADQNRKIKTAEAQAKLESAKFEALAEVERAKGTATANKIMAESLNSAGADHYLRLRYIMMLEEHKNVQREVIYIPGSALPITEAGRSVDKPVNVTVQAPEKNN